MWFPSRLRAYAKEIGQAKDGDVFQARIVCPCGSDSFALRYGGTMRKKLFSQRSIACDSDGRIALEAVCSSCGKRITIFDSLTDGYSAQIDEAAPSTPVPKPLEGYACAKCGGEKQTVFLRVEYAGMDDADDDLVLDDCFSWIWADVACAACGKRVPALLDAETT